jgi:hypothetical protein
MGRECIILLQLIEKQGPGTRDLSGAFCLLLVNADMRASRREVSV